MVEMLFLPKKNICKKHFAHSFPLFCGIFTFYNDEHLSNAFKQINVIETCIFIIFKEEQLR